MKEQDLDLLLKYLDGECTPPEIENIESLSISDPEFRKERELLQKVWQTPERAMPSPDIESALKCVKEKIVLASHKSQSKVFSINQKKQEINHNKLSTRQIFFRVAAVLLVMVIGVYLITKEENSLEFTTVNVANGQQQTVLLPDGSEVILDSGSEFKYPKEFGYLSREVYLNGEAFFKVAPDKEHPFIISVSTAEVRVLGTQFNVRSWKETEKVTIVVAEGRVSFNKKDAKDEVILTNGQISSMNSMGRPSIPENIDTEKYLSWRSREISFNNVSLEEVINQIERWYDLKLILPDESYLKNRITVHLDNRPTNQILDLVSAIMNFSYTIDSNKVYFFANN